MKLRGKFQPLSFSQNLQVVLHIEIHPGNKQDACIGWDELKDKEIDVEIVKHREKRSLRANNYSWQLTDKLSDVMVIRGIKLSKEEMHAEMIFRYGQVKLNEDGTQVVISADSKAIVTEFYAYAMKIGDGEVNGKTFNHHRIYRGSHEYTKDEMSIYIAGIVEECKEHGIQTETPEQIAKMLSLMKETS